MRLLKIGICGVMWERGGVVGDTSQRAGVGVGECAKLEGGVRRTSGTESVTRVGVERRVGRNLCRADQNVRGAMGWNDSLGVHLRRRLKSKRILQIWSVRNLQRLIGTGNLKDNVCTAHLTRIAWSARRSSLRRVGKYVRIRRCCVVPVCVLRTRGAKVVCSRSLPAVRCRCLGLSVDYEVDEVQFS